MNDVILITVTFNSSEYLSRLIESVLEQTFSVKKIIVVDNNSIQEHKNRIHKLQENYKDLIDVLWLNDNTGGAGGFSAGMSYMLENYNADWMWIMDDDAFPTANCLEKLLEDAKSLKNLGFIAPLIFGVDNQAYQLYHHKRFNGNLIEASVPFKTLNDIQDITEIEANAFVGPLFPISVVKNVGIANAGLFIYGDDTDYTYRVTRKYKGYVTPNAVIKHRDPSPDGNNYTNPKAWWKDYYEIRNCLLFVKKFGTSRREKYQYEWTIFYRTLKKIFKAITRKEYRRYRSIRIKILSKALIDGITGCDEKTLDPQQFIKMLERVRRK